MVRSIKTPFMLSLILTISTAAFAAATTNPNGDLSDQDRLIYNSTVSMCEANSIREIAEKARLWNDAYSNSGIWATLVKGQNPLKISPQFEALSSSLGFHYALTRCFGNDDKKKSIFFLSLVSLDVSGKFASWMTEISLMQATYLGLKAVGAFSLTEIPKQWSWYQALFKMIYSRPMFWKVTPAATMIAALSAETASDLYLEYARARDEVNQMAGNSQEQIDALLAENRAFVREMMKTNDRKEVELYALFIRQNDEIIKSIRSQM